MEACYTIQENPAPPAVIRTHSNLPFSQDRKDALISYLERQPFSIRAACRHVGIDPVTFYRHCEADAVFRSRVQQVKEDRIEQAEQYLADNAVSSDHPTWNIFFLKCHKPEVYNPTAKSEQSVLITVDEARFSQALSHQHVTENAIDTSAAPLEAPLENGARVDGST